MDRIKTSKEMMKKHEIVENSLVDAFPEFEDVKNRFIYGEIGLQGDLDEKVRALIAIAVLVTAVGNDLEEQLHSELHIGESPDALQEVFHQIAPYIGFGKAEKGLVVLKKVFDKEKIEVPLKKNGSVTEEDRLEKGIVVQKLIFGTSIFMVCFAVKGEFFRIRNPQASVAGSI